MDAVNARPRPRARAASAAPRLVRSGASPFLNEPNSGKLAAMLRLLRRHRGESVGAHDEVASVYDDFASVWDRHITAPALEHYNRLVEQRVKPGAGILDAGAGTGERTVALLQHTQAGAVIGLDAWRGMLDVARSKIHDSRVRLTLGDLGQLPFRDNTFDVVSCTWAIEIMADPRGAVQELIRVIKADGFVVYVFCSLPEGTLGKVLEHVIAKASSKQSALSHFLAEDERPFHRCDYSSLRRFVGGLATVATVGKCCRVTDEFLPCLEVAPPPATPRRVRCATAASRDRAATPGGPRPLPAY